MNSVMRFIVWGVMPARNAGRWRHRLGRRPAHGDVGRGDRHVARVPAGAALARSARSARCPSRWPIHWPRRRATAVGSFPDRCRLSRTPREGAFAASPAVDLRAAQRRGDLVARRADDVPRAAVVRPDDDRLDDADGDRPRSRAASHRAARHSQRRRRFTSGCGEGDARLRPRPRATDAVDTSAARGRPAVVPAAAGARLRARLLHRAVLLRPADRVAGARRRGLGDAHPGERGRGGRLPAHDPPRACRRPGC